MFVIHDDPKTRAEKRKEHQKQEQANDWLLRNGGYPFVCWEPAAVSERATELTWLSRERKP